MIEMSRVSFQYPWLIHTMCQMSNETVSLDLCLTINEYPSATPSSSSKPSSLCYDLIDNWMHSDLALVSPACAWFGKHSERCLYYGYYPDSVSGHSAEEVCCVCGGGASTLSPSKSPVTSVPTHSASPTSQCYDYVNWRDYDTGMSCEWISEGGDDWWYDDETICSVLDYLEDENGVGVFEACCVCGGGSIRDPLKPSGAPSRSIQPTGTSQPSANCVDVDGWVDIFQDDCSWYNLDYFDDILYDDESAWLCYYYGSTDGYPDYTANEACCGKSCACIFA